MTSAPAEPADLSAAPEPGADHSRLVFPEEVGQRFDALLAKLPGIASRRMALRLITAGSARLNGALAPPDHRVRLGDVVAYRVPLAEAPSAAPEPAPEGAPLPVLYEDADLIVVNKPAGLSMHPGPGHPGGTLVNQILAHAEGLSGIGGVLRPGIVHRLDKDTSGIVVVAKTDAAHVALAAQFKAHTIHRVYRALVLGHPEAPQGTIDAPLARHPQHRVKRAVVARGKYAVTHWTVERRLGPFTLLRLKLETGRTHQIRVHLAHARWPVVGDPLYGNPARVKALLLPEPVKALLLAFQRQALHAAELGFTHPITGQALEFKAKLPPDFADVVKALGSVEEPE